MTNLNNVSALFGSTGTSLYDQLGELASIKSGAYKTALKAYYKKVKTEDNSTDSSTNTSNKKTNDAIANRIKSSAESLQSAADKLSVTGNSSLFAEKDYTVKDEDGKEVTKHGVDREAILKVAKDVVSNYNSFIDSASDSTSKSVLNQTLHLTNQVKGYAKTFANAGIIIGKDNKLSIDEDSFKNADLGTLKGLFQGNGSAFQQVASKASMINITSNSEANLKKLYTSTGDYSELSTGSLLDSIF